MNISRGALAAVALISLCGCAGNTTSIKGSQVGKWALYADIQKSGDTSYSIAKLSNDPLYFDLNYLLPRVDTKEYDCGTFYGKNERQAGNDKFCPNEDLFRHTSISVARTAAWTVFTGGLGAVVATNSRYSSFDMDSFNSAVKSALTEVDRKAYTAAYDGLVEFRDSLKSQHEINVDTLNKGYASIENKYVPAYNQKYDNAKITLNIEDKSGFYDNSITAASLVAIHKNSTDLPKTGLKPLSVSFTVPPADFYTTISGLKNGIQSDFDKEKSIIESELATYDGLMSGATSSLKIENKNISSSNNYNIQTLVPDNIIVSKTQAPEIPVKLIVESKNFYDVRPKADISDKNLSVVFDGKSMKFINKTKYYLQIKSISIYYDGDISTQSSETELSPEAENALNDNAVNRLFTGLKHRREYVKMTAASAKKSKVNYGFAIKYRVVEQNIDNTLYNRTDVNLFKALSSL